MSVRKILGFLAGAAATIGLIYLFMSATHMMPRGPGWLVLIFFGGVAGSRLLDHPKEIAQATGQKMHTSTSGLRAKWWGLDRSLRLVIVASVIWFFASYFAQSDWNRNMALVFVPILVMLAGHFGYKFFVVGKDEPSK